MKRNTAQNKPHKLLQLLKITLFLLFSVNSLHAEKIEVTLREFALLTATQNKVNILIQEAIDITNVVIIDFSEDEVAEYIERCIKYLNKRFGSKYVLEIWETDEIYGQRDDEDDCSEEYKGHLMYRGKIAIYDGVFEKDIKFTGIYCEISAVFSDLLSSLETIEKETISKAS